MISVFGRSRWFLGVVGLISAVSVNVFADPLISLKAVKLNGIPIAHTNSISAAPGDVITAEVFISDWTIDGEKLLSFQTGISREALISGTRGNVLPLGWDRPHTLADDIGCTSDAGCPAEFPVCDAIPGGFGFCIGVAHDPTQGVFIDLTRPDWIFNNPASNPPASFPVIVGVDFAGPSFRYGGALVNFNGAQAYSIPPRYAGTAILVVSDDACGRFSLRILADQTLLQDQSFVPIIPVRRDGLTIDVTSPGAPELECSCLNIIATDIPNCTIDAGQPSDPDGTNPQIPDSVTFTFDCDDTTDIANISEFTRFFVPNVFSPLISTITPNGSDVTVTLTGPMLENRWNCIRFNQTGEGVCLGVMPGDVNSDGRSLAFDDPALGSNDIPILEECLNNPGTCTPYQCDINRSGVCTARDLLREIDLLVGADSYTAYNATGILDFTQQVIACPLAP